MHCPKGWICDCEKPCSPATKGRTTYTYENMDLRIFPGIQRNSKEWHDTYHTTTKTDVFLAGIASQLTVIVAYAMNCP